MKEQPLSAESEALPMVWQWLCRTQKQEISMPMVSRLVLPAHEECLVWSLKIEPLSSSLVDDSADLEAPF